jgi:D-alanyl-D-alanine carboxypeptidase
MTHHRSRAALGALTALLLLAAACSDSDSDDGASSTSESTTGVVDTSTTVGGEELPAEVTAQLEAAVADTMAEYEVPGAVVGVWVPEVGEWVVAEGVSDLETGEAMSTDLYWPVRSVTKSFTVSAILQLADEGELSLDDTIDQYVEGVPNGDQITLRQLANMSSGVADYAATEAFAEVLGEDINTQFTNDELNQFAIDAPADFEPGTDYVYSNSNTNLLGAVVEEVTGQTIDEVIDERFVQELELEGTDYLTNDADFPDPHPTGNSPGEDGELGADPPLFTGLGASGAMMSTVDDLRVWGEALGSGALVEESTHAERLVANPLSEGPEYDAYGLGIGTLEGWWGHTGEGLGITALTMHDAESGATVVILMNISGVGDHVPVQLFRDIAGILRDAGLADPPVYEGAATDSTTTAPADDATTTTAGG